MTKIILTTPAQKYAPSYIEALHEGLSLYPVDDLKNAEELAAKGFDQWQKDKHDLSIPVTLSDGQKVPRVPHSDFWLVAGDRFLGHISIRHSLNENLRKFGGHIGYAVRTSERKKGYGSLMLKLALPYAKTVGLEKALITCNDDNLGSIKIIEAAGGVLEDKVPVDIGRPMLRRRYWIKL